MPEELPLTKHRTTGPEARVLLLEAVVHLAETIPFPEITARRIAQEVHMDPNVIFRNFETLENLFLAALRLVEGRAIDVLESSDTIGITPITEMYLWMRFAGWLTLSGTDPERIGGDTPFLERFRAASLRNLHIQHLPSERGKSALLVIVIAYIQSQVLLTPTQPALFSPQAMDDSLVLLGTLISQLGELTSELGWE
jgi:AcrR family transcriptional regulator